MPNVTRISRSLSNAPSLSPVPDIGIDWFSTGDISPLEVTIDNMSFYKFSNLDAQEIQCEITLPNNFIGGTPINLLNGLFHTPAIVGNVLFRADVTLIRPSSTVEGVYPNTYTSTNVVIPVNPIANSFANIDSINLTSAGLIVIPAQARDRLRVKLYRDITGEINSSNPCMDDVYLLKKSFVAKIS